jgi:hypothetical protein
MNLKMKNLKTHLKNKSCRSENLVFFGDNYIFSVSVLFCSKALIPGMAVPGTEAKLLQVETNLASLRALLEPHGWRVHTDTENGGVLLIPISSP